MIGYLRGEILDHSDGKMLILVGGSAGQPGGVGYQVTVPHSAEYGGFLPGGSIELFIYTHVREDSLDLYGFSSRADKELFLTLLTVNGIGPKGALGILSKVSSELLIQVILEGDRECLTSIPGIGKKTAERVVLELGDTVRKKVEAGVLGELRTPGAGGKGGKAAAAAHRAFNEGPSVIRDAKAALIGLGYREQEITTLLNRVVSENEGAPAKVEDLIRSALRQLA